VCSLELSIRLSLLHKAVVWHLLLRMVKGLGAWLILVYLVGSKPSTVTRVPDLEAFVSLGLASPGVSLAHVVVAGYAGARV
jgi:hypothetical protein